MLRFESRQKYEKWKAQKLGVPPAQGAVSETEGASEDKHDGSAVWCHECGREITQLSNFCPHCGNQIRGCPAEDESKDSFGSFSERLVRKLRSAFSLSFVYYGLKSLVRPVIIAFLIYAVVSVFFGGKPFRALSGKVDGALASAAAKAGNNEHEILQAMFTRSRSGICPLLDCLADYADELGFVDRYVTARKAEREKQGENIADSVTKFKKSLESDPE
jgi:hypothetical protein